MSETNKLTDEIASLQADIRLLLHLTLLLQVALLVLLVLLLLLLVLLLLQTRNDVRGEQTD